MSDEEKTKEQLIEELQRLRQRVAELQESENQRKRSEEALWESGEKYRTILESIEDGYYEVDIAGNFTFFNDSLCRILGYPADELMGMNNRQFMDDETAKAVYQTFNTVYRTGKPVKALEHEFIRKDETRTFVEVSASLMRDPTGEPAGFRGIIRDITERKWTEEALQQREAVLGAIALAAEKFLQPGDWEQEMQAVLAYLGKAADVSRAIIWEASTSDDGKYLISGRYEWLAPDAKLAPLQGLQNLPVFRRWRDLLPRGEIFTGHVRDFGAKEQEFFVPRGIKSVLAVPIFVNDAWWGFMGFDQGVTEREWVEAEIDTLRTAASILGGALERKRAEEALQESEENFRALADNANDGIMIAMGRGAHVYANRRMAEITGYSVTELLKTTMADLVHPDQLKEVMERFQRRLEGKPAPRQYEIVFVRKDGKSVSLELTAAKTVWHGQSADIVVFRDITERKRAEEALERRALQLQTSTEVSHAASSILNPDELIQQVVNLVCERFDLYYAGLFLVDDSGKWAVLQAGTGEAGQKMVKQGHKLEVGGTSMVGWCVANKQARIALDVGEEAVRFANPLLPETRSELALPLVSRGEAIGALTIQSTQSAAFSEGDIAVLQTMAGQVANAIENARLFDSTQTALTEMEATHRRYLQKAWEDYAPKANRGYFRSEDEEGPTVEAWLPAMTTALRQLDTVIERNKQDGARLAIPLTVSGEVIGVLGGCSLDAEGWSEDEIAAVEAIVEQMALALESQRLFDEEQQASFLMGLRVKELDCLNDIGREIEETPPIPEFLQWVAERIPLAMQYPDVCLAAIEFEGQVYGAAEAARLPCQMVQVLRIGGQIVGRVHISYTEEHEFLDEENALLGDIVRRVSGYIESRRLFEQIQARAERERTIREITDQMQRATDMETLMHIAVEELNRALGGSRAYVRLGSGDPLRPPAGDGQTDEGDARDTRQDLPQVR